MLPSKLQAKLQGKRVLVVGMARTGVALAKLLAEQGALVTINDIRPEGELLSALQSLQGLSLRSEFGSHPVRLFLDQDLILVSPGVPLQQEAFEEARAQGIPISNDLELAFSVTSSPFLAVAGTNGKTTTTTLLGKIFTHAGRRVIVGGNIGTPLLPLVYQNPEAEYIIAEVSSFQLEVIHKFRPKVGIMLNITPDHLDRYASWNDYVLAKARLFSNQTADDLAIVSANDAATPQLLACRTGAGRLLFFDTKAELKDKDRMAKEGVFLQGKEVMVRFDGRTEHLCSLERIKLPGEHNRENIMAAGLTAWLCGIDPSIIQKVIDEFTGLAHRTEFVAKIKGIAFINDSKGTNVDAVIKAIQSLEGPIWLILGGRDKGNDYHPLIPLVKDRLKGIFAIGESKEKVIKFFQGLLPVYGINSFQEVVQRALTLALPGDSVLLSPACASFDMFESYAHRGQVFKQVVQEMFQAGSSGDS